MILASEAAQKSAEAELKSIEEAIERACSNGLRIVYLQRVISVETQRELKRCGYNLQDRYNGVDTAIYW
jgi:hypothetical protein